MTDPNMIIVGEAQYADATRGRTTLMDWPTLAAAVLPDLQTEFPELKSVTLAEFIRDCPYQIEFTLGECPKATKEDR